MTRSSTATPHFEAVTNSPITSMRSVHIAEIHDFQPICQSPLDRALIAQATVEDLVLMTSDETMAQYG